MPPTLNIYFVFCALASSSGKKWNKYGVVGCFFWCIVLKIYKIALKMITVKLHTIGLAKFVLLKDEDGNLILRSDLNAIFHRSILTKERMETGKRFTCLGGGQIEITESQIYAFGKSKDFGTLNNNLVESILSENSNNKLVKVQMGVGF